MNQLKIDPSAVAFDIDGVVADTMNLFLDIARDDYQIKHVGYEDITTYILEDCVGIPAEIIDAIVARLLNGNYHHTLQPIDGAAEVLMQIADRCGSLLFVTARPTLGPIEKWMGDLLPQHAQHAEIVTTGSFQAKADVLKEKGMTFFVEDRLETCFDVQKVGITPIVFKQPWNRDDHPFTEVESWKQLEKLLAVN